jgi:predicted nucleic-acid-binding protein
MIIIDSNIVLRYILGDHEDLSLKAKDIIERNAVTVPIEALCEAVYALLDVYRAGRAEIGEAFLNFFEKTDCVLPHRESVITGLQLFSVKNMDFVDCILAGYALTEDATVYTAASVERA